jgi:ABC-type multidrug transport system ATPase subunit/ABC-type nitrate/sulfonate/bicarbonate transport system permease component
MQARASTKITVRNLTAGHPASGPFAGGSRVLISKLSFEVLPGEIVGLLGPNGSGKSTLLRAIVDRRFRLGGEVLSNGHELAAGDVAYVPQAAAGTLSPWLRVDDEIALPLRIRGQSRRDGRDVAARLAGEHGLGVPLERRTAELSGGQRVKVALLRGLAVPDHRLVVMDEPFEGLDASARSALIRHVLMIAASGIGVVVTSHRAEDLEALGARKLVMAGSPVSELIPVSGDSVASEAVAGNGIVPDYQGDALSRAELHLGDRGNGALKAIVTGVLGFVLGVIAWGIGAYVVGNSALFPPPGGVGREAFRLLSEPSNLTNVAFTVGRAGVWWLVANAMAVPLGVIVGYGGGVYRLFAPWLSLGRCLPVFALVGAARGLFPGASELQRGSLIWLTVFLISLHAVAVSAAMAPRRRMEIAAIFGAGHWFRVTRVLPFECIGGIFAALEVTLPLSVIVTIVVGMFILAERDLSLDIYNNLDKPDLSKLLACVLVPGAFAAIGLALLRRFSGRLRYEV